jgi:site-specific DNA-methyltransferase (adenine-specific)
MTAPVAELIGRRRILVGDVRDRLGDLPDGSVDQVVTSPPYFQLRNYDAHGQFGTEPNVEDWVARLCAVASDLKRVLVPTGTLWLNLGDTYSTHHRQGSARKSLLLGPERVVLALTRQGWILRNKIVWAKPNPVPSSVRDRLTASWEVIYVLAKSDTYFFDLDAIREEHRGSKRPPIRIASVPSNREKWRGPNSSSSTGLTALHRAGRPGHPLGKNPSDVWTIANPGVRGHHATFPLPLAERMTLAGCPEARCIRCRTPHRRAVRRLGERAIRAALAPSCHCGSPSEPGLVLDPFMGSGTTAIAAERHRRDWLGIELNPEFAALADRRITTARADLPVLTGQAA